MAECNECKKIIRTPTGATSGLFTHVKQHSEFVEKLKNHEELKKNTSSGPLKILLGELNEKNQAIEEEFKKID